MNSKEKRKILMLEDNIEKIINDGIRPNLLKLDKCSKIIISNISNDRSAKERMNAELIIQQLQIYLKELDKCYCFLKELKIDKNFDNMIQFMKNDVFQAINNFIKTNEENNYLLHNEQNVQPNSIETEINTENRKQLSLQINQDIQLHETEKKFQEIQSLNEDIQELHDLMYKFGNLVHEQQTQVDKIEENMENAAELVHEGTTSLSKAAHSIVPITCAAVGATIFGPIGGLITLKVSTGIISAFGGSIFSYYLASYINKKKQKQSQLELENICNKK